MKTENSKYFSRIVMMSGAGDAAFADYFITLGSSHRF